jgi:hypothetical protein
MEEELKLLLSYGYFPTKELPPCFSTLSFADFYLKNYQKFSNLKKASNCIAITAPRVGLDRKVIKIPNPYHYGKICEFIAKNWMTIDSKLKKSNNSFSSPKLEESFIKEPLNTFKDFVNSSFNDSSTFSHFLKTDISKFYPSIYTHSIAWALDGKELAKQERFTRTKSLGSQLDDLIRKMQDDQSVGIPIGPFVSQIISEIINSEIDALHKDSLNCRFFQARFIDDRHMYFTNISDAEKAIINLQSILREYQLGINNEKTKITEIPNVLVPEWKIKLQNFNFRNVYKYENETDENFFSRKATVQNTDFTNYFNLVFALNKEFPSEYVFKYGIKHIQNIRILKLNWSLVESQLLKSTLKEPSVIPDVLLILLKNKEKINNTKLTEFANFFIDIHVDKSFDFETIWGLWLCNVFNIKIQQKVCEKLPKINDPFSRLLIEHLESKSLLSSKIDSKSWTDSVCSNDLLSTTWLFYYEIAVKGYFLSNFDYLNSVEGNDYFKKMKENSVSFFNDSYEYPEKEIKYKVKTETQIESDYDIGTIDFY